MDLTTLTDDQLDEHRVAVLHEQERRRRIEDTPEQVAALVAAYAADGGDPAVLVAALDQTTDAPHQEATP